MTKKIIFPVTRSHGAFRVDVEIEGGQVVDAWIGGMLFRGFEIIMAGRDPRDAALFLQRICGICSSAHAVAAAMAQQQAFRVEPTPIGQHLTNLIFAADIIQNHLRHFYLLALYDYAIGPEMSPYTPRQKGDFRLPKTVNDELLRHAEQGLKMAVRAHEMLAVFGAKVPHQQTIMASGVTERTSVDRLKAYGGILREITEFVEQIHSSDIMTIADYYKDYYDIGTGYGNLLSYGMFPGPANGQRAFKAGVIFNRGTVVETLDAAQITEAVQFSWYRDEQVKRKPAEGVTVPDIDKPDAYTNVKAPRYQSLAFESGPLARAWINGDYRRGISVMDRLVARGREVLKICRLAEEWLAQVIPGSPSLRPYTPPSAGEGIGLTDAMRGALGHWFSYEDNKITHYQVITPSTWNFSPRDAEGKRGPVEQALIGVPVTDPENLIEVGRVVRSFDPCFTCAVHALQVPNAKPIFI
nr:nickel-dependent hydrogenase large subunit [Sporomusa acidovorans]OZC19055.1 periplasmic [NiFeSe] hydrogenase large subunit [Sporomusa acidovorans DSM 3132]